MTGSGAEASPTPERGSGPPGPGLLGAAPWRRAPLLLFRQPAAALAVLVAAAILGLVTASAPLFLASAGSGGLVRILEGYCPEQGLPAVRAADELGTGYGGEPAARIAAAARADAAARRLFAERGLPEPYRVLTATAAVRAGGPRPVEVTVFARPGALDHVTVLAGTPATRGLWVSDRLAEQLGVGAGDTVRVGPATVPVAGVYADLVGSGLGGPLPRYWCSWSGVIVPKLDGTTLPFVLADEHTVLELSAGTADQSWYSGVDTARLTIPAARELTDRAGGLAEELGRQVSLPGGYRAGGILEQVTDRAAALRSGLAASVLPPALAAALVALLLVAAAGAYWAERRAGEVRLLAARGVGAAGLGAKAVLETGAAAVLGALVGWLAALLLTNRIGPSPYLDSGAPVRALWSVLVALGIALVVLAAVAGLRARSTVERGVTAGPQRGLPVPWELAVLGAAAWAYVALRDGGGVTVQRDVVALDGRLTAFPLLLLTGGVALGARAVVAALPWLASRTRRLPAAAYLASRRLTGSRAATVLALVAVAVPVGALVFSGSLIATVEANTQAKVRTYVGAEVALVTRAEPGVTPDPAGHGTPVAVIREGEVDELETQVLGVDRATFARWATWQDRFAAEPLPALLDRLRPVAGEPAPAILVQGRPGQVVQQVMLRTSVLPVQVEAELDAFPGTRLLGAPLLVVDRAALAGVDRYVGRAEEVWTTEAEVPAVLDAMRAQEIPVDRRVRPTDILGNTVLFPVTWTFGYLRLLAALTGAITITGLLLYLAARQRARVASYALGRRMGLSRRRHLVSLLLELAVVLGAGTLAGLVIARTVLPTVTGMVDVDANRPPVPSLLVPVGLVAVVVAAVAAAGLLCALVAQATADRARPAEVMRMQI
jgi:putative ABC transport system permease protein